VRIATVEVEDTKRDLEDLLLFARTKLMFNIWENDIKAVSNNMPYYSGFLHHAQSRPLPVRVEMFFRPKLRF